MNLLVQWFEGFPVDVLRAGAQSCMFPQHNAESTFQAVVLDTVGL